MNKLLSQFLPFFQAGLDVLLPSRCEVCTAELAEDMVLCGACWQALYFIDGPICYRTGAPLPFTLGPETVSLAAMMKPPRYDRARAAVHYKETARMLVHRLKFHDRPEVAALLVSYMMRAGADLLAENPIIVPVPLHFSRLLRRRYNQSAELARRLAKTTQCAYNPRLLRRVKRTSPQVGLTRVMRRDNLRGAFSVATDSKNDIKNKKVLLIDDVMTTGATVEACATVLRRAGAAKVDVLTFARVVMSEIVHI